MNTYLSVSVESYFSGITNEGWVLVFTFKKVPFGSVLRALENSPKT
jgi:hypothetical protein